MNEVRKVITLFKPGEHFETSGMFLFERQITIKGTGLAENDKVTFEILHLSAGEYEQWCNCHRVPGTPPEIEAYSVMMCPDCGKDGELVPVRLTQSNPVVVLNAPQNTIMRARFTGENVEAVSVWATLETDTKDLDPAMSGCPSQCELWMPTGNAECDTDNGIYSVEYKDAYDNIKWVDYPLEWLPTGLHRENEEDPVLYADVEEENQCGETRWTRVDLEWTNTGNIRCTELDDTSPEYMVLEERQNQFGDLRWFERGTEQWETIGPDYKCVDNRKYILQRTVCGEERWFDTEEPCQYFATYEIDSGGLAFRPGQQPPDATVALEDCDGNVEAYIYPEPKEGATVPVMEGCESCASGEALIGYAVNTNAPVIKLPANKGTQIIRGSIDSVPALDIKSMPAVEIRNLPEQKVFDGIIRSIPELRLAGIGTLDVRIDKLPAIATNTFTFDGKLYVLYSDGTYERLIVPTVDAVFRIMYLLNGINIAGDAPVDETEYKPGDRAMLAVWPRELPDGLRLRGWSRSPNGETDAPVHIPGTRINVMDDPGAGINMIDSVYLYAQWDVAISYVDGTSDEVTGMPAREWHKAGTKTALSGNIPVREGYTFSGWISDAGYSYNPGGEITVSSPVVLRAKWTAIG